MEASTGAILLSGNNGDDMFGFEAVPVPEPGTGSMGIVGGLALLALRRRRI